MVYRCVCSQLLHVPFTHFSHLIRSYEVVLYEDGILPTPAHSRCMSSQLAEMICSTSLGDDFTSARLKLEQLLLAVRVDVLLSPR